MSVEVCGGVYGFCGMVGGGQPPLTRDGGTKLICNRPPPLRIFILIDHSAPAPGCGTYDGVAVNGWGGTVWLDPT